VTIRETHAGRDRGDDFGCGNNLACSNILGFNDEIGIRIVAAIILVGHNRDGFSDETVPLLIKGKSTR